MPDIGKTWIAVPVFNHSVKLAGIVDAILKTCPNLVIIDDGSTDADLGKMLSGRSLELISHGKNLGKGRAIITAADFIASKGGEYMITIDADGQHRPEEISLFLESLHGSREKFIIGARDFNNQPIPLPSRLGRRISNFLVKVETRRELKDTQSGFRAYPVSLFSRITCKSSGFSFETEIIVRAIWKGYDVSEIDISVDYPRGKERVSHFGFFKDNIRILLLHCRLIFEMMLRLFHG